MRDYHAEYTALMNFLVESNLIEGIRRPPTSTQILSAQEFLSLSAVSLENLNALQATIAPGKPLRTERGMNVSVGDYYPPKGGSSIKDCLENLLEWMNRSCDNPWQLHCDFQSLHPYMDGNGRTGRLLWAVHMRRLGRDPFQRSFLHEFYYQTLARRPT